MTKILGDNPVNITLHLSEDLRDTLAKDARLESRSTAASARVFLRRGLAAHGLVAPAEPELAPKVEDEGRPLGRHTITMPHGLHQLLLARADQRGHRSMSREIRYLVSLGLEAEKDRAALAGGSSPQQVVKEPAGEA